MGAETILGISAIFTESPEFPGGFNGNTGTSRYAGASMAQGGPPRSSRASSPTTPRATAGRRMPDHPHLSHGSAATADRPHRRHDPHHCPPTSNHARRNRRITPSTFSRDTYEFSYGSVSTTLTKNQPISGRTQPPPNKTDECQHANPSHPVIDLIQS